MKQAFSVLLLLLICGCNNIPKQISSIKAHKLSIPTHEMVAWSPDTSGEPTTNSRHLNLVFYVSKEQCQSCFFSQLIKFEHENYESLANQDVSLVYIFDAQNIDREILEEELRSTRTRGHIFIDTCRTFLNMNKHIPDNPLYHTFVADNSGNIIMVGNPFQNSRMDKLFKKVIESERKRKNS